jgi:hypothetical protein
VAIFTLVFLPLSSAVFPEAEDPLDFDTPTKKKKRKKGGPVLVLRENPKPPSFLRCAWSHRPPRVSSPYLSSVGFPSLFRYAKLKEGGGVRPRHP